MGTWARIEDKREYERLYRLSHPERRQKMREYGRAFYRRNKKAQSERSLAWYRDHKGQAAAANKRWKQLNADWAKTRRWVRVLRDHGLSIAEYEALLAEQKSACAICGESGLRLYIDHNHRTGKVRGLLCPYCNLALGGFRDSVDLLLAAARYLS